MARHSQAIDSAKGHPKDMSVVVEAKMGDIPYKKQEGPVQVILYAITDAESVVPAPQPDKAI